MALHTDLITSRGRHARRMAVETYSLAWALLHLGDLAGKLPSIC